MRVSFVLSLSILSCLAAWAVSEGLGAPVEKEPLGDDQVKKRVDVAGRLKEFVSRMGIPLGFAGHGAQGRYNENGYEGGDPKWGDHFRGYLTAMDAWFTKSKAITREFIEKAVEEFEDLVKKLHHKDN